MILLAGTPPAGMKRASTKWTTVARVPLAAREGRARAVLRARRTSHNVSSRRLQSAPKARQIEAAAKEQPCAASGCGFLAPRGSPVGRREQRILWRSGSVANAKSPARSTWGNIARTRMNSGVHQKQGRLALFGPSNLQHIPPTTAKPSGRRASPPAPKLTSCPQTQSDRQRAH